MKYKYGEGNEPDEWEKKSRRRTQCGELIEWFPPSQRIEGFRIAVR